MKLSTALSLLLALAPTSGTMIHVGGMEIEIPDPPGFVAVTPEMPTLHDFQKHFVAPENEEFVSFISAEGAPAARRGELPDMTRRFSVQAAKSFKLVMFSGSDFRELTSFLKSENAALIEAFEEERAGAVEHVNQGLEDEYDLDLALEVTQFLPLPPHDETPHTLALSAYAKYSVKGADGEQSPYVAAFTATFIHVRGKILFLYCYGSQDDLEWTRHASKAWAQAILAANAGART